MRDGHKDIFNMSNMHNDIFNMIDVHKNIYNIIHVEMHDDNGNMIDNVWWQFWSINALKKLEKRRDSIMKGIFTQGVGLSVDVWECEDPHDVVPVFL